MKTYKINDSLFDALFRQTVIDTHRDELRSCLELAGAMGPFEYSERHITRMKKLLAREARQERFTAIMQVTRRVAVFAVLAVVVLFGALLTSRDVRAAISRTVIQWYEQFTTFTGQRHERPLVRLEPLIVPTGFAEIQRIDTVNATTIVYSDEAGVIMLFTVFPADSTSAIDNEQSDYVSVEKRGTVYYVFDAEAADFDSTILWEHRGYRYRLSAPLSVETLLDVALSVG